MYLSVCLITAFVYLSVCLSDYCIRVSVCLSDYCIRVSVCLSVCLITAFVYVSNNDASLPSHHPGKAMYYFYTGFVAYIVGLGTTIFVMHVFQAAQPALLYLVPSCLGLPFLVALIRGEVADLLR